jgi:hypothetical protein
MPEAVMPEQQFLLRTSKIEVGWAEHRGLRFRDVIQIIRQVEDVHSGSGLIAAPSSKHGLSKHDWEFRARLPREFKWGAIRDI